MSESADHIPSMTRTTCTQIFNNKRICKPYNCSPFTTGFHEATDSTAVTSSGWKVESLLTQLGSANHRQMGDRDSQRLSNSLCGPPSTGMQAKCSYILLRATPSDSRSESFVGKGCSPRLQPSTSREFLLDSLVPKKGGQINLKRLNEWVTPQHFKIEGMSTLRELLKTNNWMAKIDLKDAYFTIPDASHSPTFSKVYGKSTALPVYMSPIQPVLCSMGLHKSDETHINLPLKYGGTYDCLHRQHTCDGGVPRAGEGPPGGIYLSIDRPGVCHQHTEVTTPAQRIDYLGLLVDLTTLHLSLPGEKLYHIRSEIDQITKKSSPITARQLA